MISITEVKQNHTSIFFRTYATSNNVVLDNKSFYYRLYKPEVNGRTVFVLYADNMQIISPVYDYLNFALAGASVHTQNQSAHALRLLYCFLDITNSRLDNLQKKEIDKLIYFLLGFSPNEGSFAINLLTTRNNATVNSYLSVIREYLSHLDIECPALHERYLVTEASINPKTENPRTRFKFSNNLKTRTPANTVPKYISVSEFSELIDLIRKDNNILAECIIRLMFQFGLRIGEVLGATFEDLTEIKIEDDLYPVLFIRNRVSDRPWQKAKSCMNIHNVKQYKSKNYTTKNLGYQSVMLTYDVFELLNSYIEILHTIARKNNQKRYTTNAIADKTSQTKYADDNYYIFLNSWGDILSQQTWNKSLKKFFKLAEMTLDRNFKISSLNHRFRHGFAMFHVQHAKTPILELKELMRHRDVSSTMIYYNPTEKDEAEIKNKYVTELYDLVPDLKAGCYYGSIE